MSVCANGLYRHPLRAQVLIHSAQHCTNPEHVGAVSTFMEWHKGFLLKRKPTDAPRRAARDDAAVHDGDGDVESDMGQNPDKNGMAPGCGSDETQRISETGVLHARKEISRSCFSSLPLLSYAPPRRPFSPRCPRRAITFSTVIRHGILSANGAATTYRAYIIPPKLFVHRAIRLVYPRVRVHVPSSVLSVVSVVVLRRPSSCPAAGTGS